MDLECKRCNWKWNYKGSNSYYATCPHCRTKVKVTQIKPELIVDDKPKEAEL